MWLLSIRYIARGLSFCSLCVPKSRLCEQINAVIGLKFRIFLKHKAKVREVESVSQPWKVSVNQCSLRALPVSTCPGMTFILYSQSLSRVWPLLPHILWANKWENKKFYHTFCICRMRTATRSAPCSGHLSLKMWVK